jgi:hypothetical protein
MTSTNSFEAIGPKRGSDQVADHVRLHADHLLWFSENSLWRDDISSWQREVDEAVRQLGTLRDAFDKHHEKLRKHAASIRLHEQRQAEHECALAKYERGGSGQELVQMARAHQDESTKQAELRDLHENLKRRHHEMIAQLHAFLRSIA